jgi:hypothetical protein
MGVVGVVQFAGVFDKKIFYFFKNREIKYFFQNPIWSWREYSHRHSPHPYILNLKNQMFVIYNEELSEMRELLHSDGCMEIHHNVG